METITITRPQLKAALLRWEQDSRAGKMRDPVECASLPAEQVAAESTQHLWSELKGGLSAGDGTVEVARRAGESRLPNV